MVCTHNLSQTIARYTAPQPPTPRQCSPTGRAGGRGKNPFRLGARFGPEMAVRHSAALANQFFPAAPIGVLAAGAQADIIFVDYHPTTPLTVVNLPWHILFGFEASMVDTTICGGEVLMRNRELLTLDEAEITARSRELAAGVWKRFSD